jgi:hypothetical protein
VLGEVDFTSSTGGGLPPSQNNFGWLYDISMDLDGNILAMDGNNHNRVLKFSSPFTNGQNASSVFGQADFTSALVNRGGIAAANTLCCPVSAKYDWAGNLWIVDMGNNRVLRFNVFSVDSVSRNFGYNNKSGVSAVNINGSDFLSGSLVKLKKSGETDITASNINVANSSKITCSFDLTGKATGYWNVYVSSGYKNTLLTNGFEIRKMTVVSITPACGRCNSVVSVTELSGLGFLAGSSVKLAKSGQADVSASSVTVVNSSRITCKFDLTGKATGYWNVVVSSGDINATLSNGFLVEAPVTNSSEIDCTKNNCVSVVFESGETKLDIPTGAFGSNITLSISTSSVPSSDRPTIKVSLIGIEVLNSLNTQPLKELTLTVGYRNTDIAGLDETKLILARYEPNAHIWVTLASTVDTINKRVVAHTSHLSRFAIVQLAPAADLSSVRIYPNPYRPSVNTNGITFDGLTAGAKIRVFNVAGELVREIADTNGSGVITFDGKNNGGSSLASGVYIAYIDGSNGTAKVKFSIIK